MEQDKQPEGYFKRYYVPKDWSIPAVAGLIFVATIHGTIEGQTIDVPAQAAGSALSGSISSTAAYSSFIAVADTNFDKTYEARYATLRVEVEQSPGKAIPNPFSVTLRST